MTHEIATFEVMHNCRAMRRLNAGTAKLLETGGGPA